MSTLINTFKIKETEKGTTFFILEERRDSQDKKVWVLFTERNNKIIGSVDVIRRLDSETKKMFKIK